MSSHGSPPELRSRIDSGRFVVEEEWVTGAHLEGLPNDAHAVVIYRIEAGSIRHVRVVT